MMVSVLIYILLLLSMVAGSPFRELADSTLHVIPPPNVLECTLTCQNGGSCQALHQALHHNNTVPQRCKCESGYAGLACEIESKPCFNMFGQDFFCQAGSPCVLSNDRNKYQYCDCHQAYSVSAFAGLDCDFSASEYCTDDKSISFIAFCTNGGQCKSYISDDTHQGHPGCDCSYGFTGDHCEYLDGMVPVYEASTGAKPFSAFIIFLLCGALILLACLIGRWWCRTNKRHPPVDEYDFDDELDYH